ncbi:MAG: Do family serine endopeptidase [Bacteroidia bacterium]
MKNLKAGLGYLFVGALSSLLTLYFYQRYTPKSVKPSPFVPLMPTKWEITPPADLTLAAKMAMPAVVYIRVKGENSLPSFFFGPSDEDQPLGPSGSGSGVIISPDGYIVTSNHVIEKATQIEVTLLNNQTYRAQIVGKDPSTDLAVLKIATEEELPTLPYGNSDELQIGEWVLAVGNPFGLTSTVTAGIVSAKGRSLNLLNDKFRIESFIQTDAAVNPGNSGGALVNLKGELVGINTAIASLTGTFAGYSFAVPVSIVKKVVDDLTKYGEVQRAFLGVVISDITPEIQENEDIAVSQGVYIREVNPESAAEEAGLKPGDVIIKVGEVPVKNTAELQEQIGRYRPGDEVKITYLRGDKSNVVQVTLHGKEAYTPTSQKASLPSKILGAEFAPLSEKDKALLDVPYGVKVQKLYEGKLKEIGVEEGFVITKIDKKPVTSPKDIEKILSQAEGGILIEGLYSRNRKAYYALSL